MQAAFRQIHDAGNRQILRRAGRLEQNFPHAVQPQLFRQRRFADRKTPKQRGQVKQIRFHRSVKFRRLEIRHRPLRRQLQIAQIHDAARHGERVFPHAAFEVNIAGNLRAFGEQVGIRDIALVKRNRRGNRQIIHRALHAGFQRRLAVGFQGGLPVFFQRRDFRETRQKIRQRKGV